MDDPVVRERVAAAMVARLASIDPDGRAHLVPIVFVLDGDTLYTAVDAKAKRSRRLRRIENARERPEVTVLRRDPRHGHRRGDSGVRARPRSPILARRSGRVRPRSNGCSRPEYAHGV